MMNGDEQCLIVYVNGEKVGVVRPLGGTHITIGGEELGSIEREYEDVAEYQMEQNAALVDRLKERVQAVARQCLAERRIGQ